MAGYEFIERSGGAGVREVKSPLISFAAQQNSPRPSARSLEGLRRHVFGKYGASSDDCPIEPVLGAGAGLRATRGLRCAVGTASFQSRVEDSKAGRVVLSVLIR